MKPISLYVDATDYETFKALAAERGRPVADMIREAMSDYLVERRNASSLVDLEPLRAGRALRGWDQIDDALEREALYDELLAGRT